MLSKPIDIDNIQDGVDRKQLSSLKERFLTLNQQRFTRTYNALSDRQQQFLMILPLLFHVNHPMLPGYISHSTPAGLAGYKPDKNVLRCVKAFARSFQYRTDLKLQPEHIDALYIMGSIGTIAQTERSDLDVWVCRALDLSVAAVAELQKKCEAITLWAKQQIHLDAHFFVMQDQEFNSHQKQQLTSEGSGSAQHYLLLDEFYRTALWLGGKLPLWWFVPVSQEHNYEAFTAELLRKRFINALDVIDFGGLPEIPPNEFIGAGIWQLYKAIESPYKSILKLLLLEVYAHKLQGDAQLTQPLALRFKAAIYADIPNANLLDPYVMVYRCIEAYLEAQNQPQRLALVRRCFYIKVNQHLSRSSRSVNKPWQRILLEGLVAEWQWDKHQLHMLDNRSYWKSPHVQVERNLLVNELTHSYRLLNELSKHLQEDAAISSEELLVLGRKLHAAFERKAGKIEWINPSISRDLSEHSLCFVCDYEEGVLSWQVLRGRYADVNLRSHNVAPIKRARSLIELLFWCQVNGILVSGTHVDILGEKFLLSGAQKQQLLQTIEYWLATVAHGVDHEAFTRPARVERVMMIFNTGVEPQANLHKKGLQMLSAQSDALGFSGFKENLVINVDVVHINSWGELICRHYPGDALVSALLHYFRLLPAQQLKKLPELSLQCFSSGQGHNIVQRLSELWRDLISCFYSARAQPNSRYIFEMGSEYLVVQLLHQQPQIGRFNSYEKMLHKLSMAQHEFSPLVIDRYALRDKPLRVMNEVIKKNFITIFYQLEGASAHVNLVDEKGSFYHTQQEFYNQQALLRPFIGFVRAVLQRQQFDGASQPVADIKIFELCGNFALLQGTCVERPIGAELIQHQFIAIKAVAEWAADESIHFSIFCEEQEFSALSYGIDIFPAVAQYIYQRRKHGERYPCYITDLDLSQCGDAIGQQTGLQLGHYLQIKRELEQKLNQALAAC